MCTRPIILIMLGISITSYPLVAQSPDTLWTRTYGGAGSEVAYSVIETSQGYYLATGYTTSFGAGDQDAWLLKMDKDGDTIWAVTFGGAAYDGTHHVLEAADGGYLLVGFTESFGQGAKDVYLVKTDAHGNEEWNKTYGGALQDVGYAGCVAPGGYMICGYIDGPSGWTKGDLWVLKIDESGDTSWTTRYGGAGEDFGTSIRPLDEGFIMSGVNSASGSKDLWLVKLNQSGDTMWTRIYGGAGEDVGYGVNVSPHGGHVVTGYVDGTGAWTPGDLWLLKTDDAGDTTWSKTYSAGDENFGFDIYPTTDGGYAIGGLKGLGAGDLWILKTDEAGDTTWTGAWGGIGRDNALSMYVTSDGGYLAGGLSIQGASPALYLVKTRPVLDLISPNGGENLAAGSPYIVRWHVENTSLPPHSFTLLYSTDGGESYDSIIAAEISPQDTSYEWTVPGLECQTCRVKVQLHDGFFDIVAEDESDDNFVVGASIAEFKPTKSSLWIQVESDNLSYHIPCEGHVRVSVFDITGQNRRTLVKSWHGAGTHSLTWDGLDGAGLRLPPGVYFVCLESGKSKQVTKFVILN